MDAPVAPGGYAWWYLDGQSDDGAHAVTAIAFVGNVFSPNYARDRARGQNDPARHLAINLALYGQKRAWVFTEAADTGQSRTAQTLTVGGNTWRQTDDGVELTIDDRTVPWGRKVRGRITLRGLTFAGGARRLDGHGRHHWWPIRPVSRIEVDMQRPKLRWQGHAYHDLNYGDEPLVTGFRAWSWMRITTGNHTDIAYAPVPREGAVPEGLHLRFGANGTMHDRQAWPLQRLRPSGWGVPGEGYGMGPEVRLVEDTPFYRRTSWLVPASLGGGAAMHETLDMGRWARGWVQKLMHFRLRRLR